MTDFERVHLFGKAISSKIPTGYIDASNIRQVPDHQEVFLDRCGFASIIFEINEYILEDDNGETLDDHHALLYHFDDIVSGTDEKFHIESSGCVKISSLPDVPARRLTATQQPSTTVHQQTDLPSTAAILLILIRLAVKNTDILITINIPPSSEQPTGKENSAEENNTEENKLSSLIKIGMLCQDQITGSFRINDWSLFI